MSPNGMKWSLILLLLSGMMSSRGDASGNISHLIEGSIWGTPQRRHTVHQWCVCRFTKGLLSLMWTRRPSECLKHSSVVTQSPIILFARDGCADVLLQSGGITSNSGKYCSGQASEERCRLNSKDQLHFKGIFFSFTRPGVFGVFVLTQPLTRACEHMMDTAGVPQATTITASCDRSDLRSN